MKLYYDIKDKPKFPQLVVYAIQQLLAIMAATLVVPIIIGNGMQPSAALFGAGVGTLVYVAFTKANSPVFLGSSFAFLGSMGAAFAGAVSAQAGYAGIILGAIFAGLVYVAIALVVKFAGVAWIDKLMPKQVIGPTVAIIGLSLAGNAVGDLQKGKFMVDAASQIIQDGQVVDVVNKVSSASPLVAIACGLVTLFVTMICSTYGKKSIKLIPFIIGILSGYAFAVVVTLIGTKTGNDALKLMDFSVFSGIKLFALPEFTFLTAMKGIKEIDGAYIGTIAAAYLPVAFVVFAEHIADHKNISSIIGKDLLKEPGLHRTLLGDGVGSMVGAFFGGCPNTTYGESVACVALTRNASVYTIITAAIGAIIIAFFQPFVAFVDSIPSCVMGGVCMALYGFIAVSGLKMVQAVNLEDNKNLYTVSVILIAGIGGLTLNFGKVTITSIACALILGIITNLILAKGKAPAEAE
ncbi:MAG: uracil-xanthine permease [Clostridia bacterium]|nr:uracil-xanthine permease [Clostridia bacterium]